MMMIVSCYELHPKFRLAMLKKYWNRSVDAVAGIAINPQSAVDACATKNTRRQSAAV